jgi:DnaJ like chaperone protein
MLWPGTLIGAGAGFAIASIPGALLGALLGQALDRRLQLHSWAQLRERLGGRPALRNDELLFVLLGRLAKSNGRVVDGHIQQARLEMRALDMSEHARRRAITAFNRGKSGSDRVRTYLRVLKAQPHAAEGVLRACWRMAWADGRADEAERDLIDQWGRWLGWTPQQLHALACDYAPERKPLVSRSGAYQEALRILGVTATSEPSAIKRACPAQVREATERTRELHNAYALIRERRDFR